METTQPNIPHNDQAQLLAIEEQRKAGKKRNRVVLKDDYVMKATQLTIECNTLRASLDKATRYAERKQQQAVNWMIGSIVIAVASMIFIGVLITQEVTK